MYLKSSTVGYLWYITLVLSTTYVTMFYSKQYKWSAILFNFNCLFRAIFPRIDALRLCFIIHPFSDIHYGRIAATLGEIAFVWSVCCYIDTNIGFYKRILPSALNQLLSCFKYGSYYILLNQVCIAQGLCWSAVILQDNSYHVLEEQRWHHMSFYLGVSSVIFLVFSWISDCYKLVGLHLKTIVVSFIFCLYISQYDIPMYEERIVQQNEQKIRTLSLKCQYFTKDIHHYGGSAILFLGYFILGPIVLHKIHQYTDYIKSISFPE